MQNWLKGLYLPVVISGLLAYVGGANAADNSGRAGYARVNRAANGNAATQRMPSMPTMPIMPGGNLSIDIPSNPVVTVVPNNPGPDIPDNPDNPDVPDNPVTPECPDGGVKNSTYTIQNCMDSIMLCVSNGLPNGLNSLFDEDLRNSIVNGMGLCRTQVERCVTDVRQNCSNVYRSSADVWIDFNSRRVQPEYYNFVLRKTGLTPNQAENTCRLLDMNTYGSSFAAVSTSGNVSAEYNKQVGAYNSQNGGVLIKTNPLGADVNIGNAGVDGQRGHYARWDAATADCFIRVAAYNKDTHIKNSWLFGAAGDNEPAEVWRAAGDTFSCNKDLFGFSLMNKTSTAAVVGVAGGTVLGAGIGALAAHGKRAFSCDNEKHRQMLFEEFRADGTIRTINEYLTINQRLNTESKTMDKEQCEGVLDLFDRWHQTQTALVDCVEDGISSQSVRISFSCDDVSTQSGLNTCFNTYAAPCLGQSGVAACGSYLINNYCKNVATADACVTALRNAGVSENAIVKPTNATDNGTYKESCTFQPLNLDKVYGTGIYCQDDDRCKKPYEITQDVNRLGSVFTADIDTLIAKGEKSTIGKGVAIGAAVGAGTGGLATAITALVERSNINCRVGDNLAQVGFGKSYSIGSLKDFYVKWNLKLPDTVQPTAMVTDCASWHNVCGMINDMNYCKNAQINYKPLDAATMTLVRSACTPSGSVCIENYTVAKSHGACK